MSDNNLPIIFESAKKSSFLVAWFPKLVFGVLGLIVLAELVIGIRTLQQASATSKQQNIRIIPSLEKPTLSLKTDKTQFKVNEVIPVKVLINTGGKNTVGTDVVIKFSPKLFGPIPAQPIVPGTMFREYPLTSIDANTGVIKISGISSISQTGFQGTGEFATINLVAKSPGSGELSFDFKPGQTNDSNIIEEGSTEDILTNVNNLKITVNN